MRARFLLVLMLSALASSVFAQNASTETLRQYADKIGFRIGTGIRPKSWDQDEKGREILGREFNATLVMGMMGSVQPEKGRFDFSKIDRTVSFAKQHKMKVYGAALIYRADSLPEWMRAFAQNPAALDEIMKNDIQTVVKHGGDAFYAWGVVNEPLSNPNQPWEKRFGRDEYIAKAFRYARPATKAELVLNETFGLDGVDRAKTDEFFALIHRLRAQGVPIDAAGIEMHLEAQQLRPTYLDEFKYWLSQARNAGVHAYITEMDVYQGPPGAIPDAMENQKKIYHDIAATCLSNSNCKGLTVWDLSDKDTWLATKRRNPHPDAKPDLFDANDNKKPAYYGVLEALKERAARN